MNKVHDKFIALVGLGYWGKNILRNLYELEALYTACDCDRGILSDRKNKFPYVNYTSSFVDILRDPHVKAVVIAVPAAGHYKFARDSLLADKDVLVEKPLALTVKEGDELVKLAEQKNKILMVGHILQYHPAVIKLKELISTGELGTIQYIYSNRLNIGKLRTEENILWSFAPHDISAILMLLEEEPVRVSGSGGAYVNKKVYDTTLMTLEFKNKVKGHIFVNWLHPYKEQKLIVVGSKAMAVFDDVSDNKLCLYQHKIKCENGKIPVAQKAEHQVISIDGGEPLKRELSHFIECVLAGKTPKTDGAEGVKVLKVLESAEKAFLGSEGLRKKSADPGFFVHESAYVDDDVKIGEGTKIWHFSHVLNNSKLGKGCIIGQNVVIGAEVNIGDRCKIQNNVSLYKGVTLEDDVFCGPSCVFTNVYNPRAFIERKDELRETVVKKGATIGANATIICGATIGKYALVGAGAVVKLDVPDYAIVAGVPAKRIGWICKCGVSLIFDEQSAVCNDCGSEYKCDADKLAVVHET